LTSLTSKFTSFHRTGTAPRCHLRPHPSLSAGWIPINLVDGTAGSIGFPARSKARFLRRPKSSSQSPVPSSQWPRNPRSLALLESGNWNLGTQPN
jgi:hypothetical protein